MLGQIEQVDLRSIWKHEANDFTKWLAEEENIQALASKVGIQMQTINTEVNVGSFSADILAEESSTGEKIVIENQLEMTDHDHLGKIITYASGLGAKYIIWIFREIREEHRRAIDWLNEITDEGLNIFAIKLEVWKIGESLPAPVFNVVCSPNDWQKVYKQSTSSKDLTDTRLIQLNFWEGFSEFISNNKQYPFKATKAHPQHWYDVSIGTSQAHICFTFSPKGKNIQTDLYIQDNKALYSKLYEAKDVIEDNTGFALSWNDTAKKSSRIAIRGSFDIQNEKVEDAYIWLLEHASKILKATKRYF